MISFSAFNLSCCFTVQKYVKCVLNDVNPENKILNWTFFFSFLISTISLHLDRSKQQWFWKSVLRLRFTGNGNGGKMNKRKKKKEHMSLHDKYGKKKNHKKVVFKYKRHHMKLKKCINYIYKIKSFKKSQNGTEELET